jgi:hypothetical protein
LSKESLEVVKQVSNQTEMDKEVNPALMEGSRRETQVHSASKVAADF